LKFLIFLFLIHSCASVNEQSSEKEEPNRIVFVTYKIKKNKGNETEVSFLNHKLVDGKIKGYSNNDLNTTEGDLKCTFLDNKRTVLQVVNIKNPLKRIVEYVNDSGNLEKRLIELDSSQFIIRAPFIKNTQYLELREVTKGEKQKKLLSTKL